MQSLCFHSIPSPSCIHNPNWGFGASTKTPPGDPFTDALHSLRTCTETENRKLGSCHHARILKLGIEGDVYVGNSLLNVYSKNGQIKHAQNLFDEMPVRTTVSWTSVMSAYQRIGESEMVIALFKKMLESLQPNEYTLSVVLQACAMMGESELVQVIHGCAIKNALDSDDFLLNCLIDAYAKSGLCLDAEELLQRLCNRDVVSWTSIISGCVRLGDARRALKLFFDMQVDGIVPSDVTMLTILQACSEISDRRIMQWIHGMILKGNWIVNALVLNSLIEMYAKNGMFYESMLAFCCFCFGNNGLYPSLETMANLLQGCANFGSLRVGRGIHGFLIKHGFLPSVVVENSIMNMYSKNGQQGLALCLFRKMEKRDVISWNTIINGFVKNGNPIAALGLLAELCQRRLEGNISPDFVTMLASLEACSELALLLQGQVIHGYLIRTGLLHDIFVQNALIDAYAKSGRVDYAKNIFTEMDEKDIGSWNSIIAAHGINGNANDALNAFNHLREVGTIEPNAITFVNIVTACAHAGFVEEGFKIFNSIEKQYGTKLSMEHFTAMVDLLGRAGRIKEAERFIQNMPVQAGADVWGALLSACVQTKNLAVAEKAAKEIAILDPQSSAWRVALSNAYAGNGKWGEAAKIRARVRKEGGWSSLNVEGREYSFMAGDSRKCPKREVVYQVIASLHCHMSDAQIHMEFLNMGSINILYY